MMNVAVTLPKALVVRAPGTNRDPDIAFAFERAGATSERASLARLQSDASLLDSAQILVFAGGFSYADALGAGSLVGLLLSQHLGDSIREFVVSGRPVLGVCNGFQMLVRSGLLPGSLTHNAQGSFVCDWVTLAPTAQDRSVWTREISEPIDCPVAHGEGRYVATDETIRAHSALQYASNNPNGSMTNTAGVTDSTGLILGMMPHPENHVLARQHPQWSRSEQKGLALSLFRGGVNHVKARG